jgi:hypothetical protein
MALNSRKGEMRYLPIAVSWVAIVISLLLLASTCTGSLALAQEPRRTMATPEAGRGEWSMHVVSDDLFYPWDIIASVT